LATLAIAAALLSLAPRPAEAVSVIGPNRDEAEAIDCTGPLKGGHTLLARTPSDRPKVKRTAPDAWSKQVATLCPSVDPSWSRARNKTVKCGYYSSSYRYTCTVIATPARKRR
jgi:hypothetical protein